MTDGGSAIEVRLGFMPGSETIDDPDHPGLLRAGPRTSGPYGRESVEFHRCAATDACRDDAVTPDLPERGFDVVDLSPFADLQEVLAQVVEAAHVTNDHAAAIRAALQGVTLRCSGGTTAQVSHIADEGFIMRKSGPNGMAVVGRLSNGMNDHGGATSVHADQDVYGTPLKQLMDERAPELFRHDSPNGHNHDSTMMLVNLWIPLQQITQPLVMADTDTIDRRRHQLRYGLATEAFLERDDEQAINDIWTFLHHPDQRWYLRSEMDHTSGYLFNTLSTPHGAGTLPGEEAAEQCYRALEEAEQAVVAADAGALRHSVAPVQDVVVPDDTPPALRAAVAEMVAVADRAHDDPTGVCGPGAGEWSATSQAVRGRVIRMSLELRLVVSIDA